MLAMLAALDDSVGRVVTAWKAAGLYSNSVIVFQSDNGGAVADGSGPPAPAPAGSGMGQQGSMNNYPLRGGKGGYFEGGVRVASFVHSPLLPPAVVGTTLDATISVADWWATLVTLAGLEPADSGFVPDHSYPLPAPWGCYEHGKCTFAPDSINMWPLLTGACEPGSFHSDRVVGSRVVSSCCLDRSANVSKRLLPIGANKTAPRTELMLGIMSGGALIVEHLKYIEGLQGPDWWYGPHSPNCTSDTGTHPFNCEDGCLFDLDKVC
eukprot:COSAG06_NODE_329_length_17412_cov_9.404015_2_plen_266_part_00